MVKQNSEYKINSYTENETKNGDLMAKVQLVDTATEEKLNCVIWGDCLVKIEKRTLKVGNVISVTEHDFNEKFNNYIIKQIRVIKEASIGFSETEREILFGKIINIIQSFKDEKLKIEILELLKQNKELFKISPAARTQHHNYIGGLMQHILESVDYAKALFPVIPVDIDHELVLSGCITHDLGKMFEYIINTETGIVLKNEKFLNEWISHIHWGFSWANQNGYTELAHIIASHHGIKDYGALVEPATREAELFHEIDMLSSRLGRLSVEELEKLNK
ncbi:MAG: HDIG domain-containing metalloprotein [bacterium]